MRHNLSAIGGFGLLTGIALFSSGAGFAQEIERPEKPGALHSAWVFKLLCYDPMPDVAPVEKMAGELGFVPIEGDALKAYAPPSPTTYLKAWQVSDHERIFKLSIAISRAEAWVGETFPAFKDGTAISCSVNLPGVDSAAEVGKMMEKLVARPRDEGYEAGPFSVSSWSAVTDDNVFIAYHYAPKNGNPGGLLNLTTLKK